VTYTDRLHLTHWMHTLAANTIRWMAIISVGCKYCPLDQNTAVGYTPPQTFVAALLDKVMGAAPVNHTDWWWSDYPGCATDITGWGPQQPATLFWSNYVFDQWMRSKPPVTNHFVTNPPIRKPLDATLLPAAAGDGGSSKSGDDSSRSVLLTRYAGLGGYR
jgi:hypothetical protein